jgi:hypothetical protein
VDEFRLYRVSTLLRVVFMRCTIQAEEAIERVHDYENSLFFIIVIDTDNKRKEEATAAKLL